MTVVISTSLIAVFLAFLSKYNALKHSLEIGFLIITFVACIHYDYGNDYMAYYYEWMTYRNMTLEGMILTFRYKSEIGWLVLNKIFSFNYGFFWMVAVLNIIQNLIYYIFIRKFVSNEWRWVAMFIYVFSCNLYLLNFSMMRQGLAISLVVLSFVLEKNEKKIAPIISVLLGASVHTSAIICLPLLLSRVLKFKHAEIYGVLIAIGTAILYTSKDVASSLFKFAIKFGNFGTYYEIYSNNLITDNFGLGFALMSVPYIVILYFMIFRTKTLEEIEKHILITTFCGFLVTPFQFVGVALVSRIAYYFQALLVAVVPMLYCKIKNLSVRIILLGELFFITGYTYIAFFNSPVWIDSYSKFHTIFDMI